MNRLLIFNVVFILIALIAIISCSSNKSEPSQEVSQKFSENETPDSGTSKEAELNNSRKPTEINEQPQNKNNEVVEKSNQDEETYETTSEVIESKIDGEFNGFDSDKVFKLTNGQVWQQDEYKYSYSYKYRPDVTIVKSGISYKMIVDGIDEGVKVKLLSGSVSTSKRRSGSDYTPDVIESYISNNFSGFNNGNIYKLDNGQVWEQTEYYMYSYSYSHPKIMIYRSGGQYKLKFDNIDRAVTVKKIN